MSTNTLIPMYILPTSSSGAGCTSSAWHSVAFGGTRVTAIVNPNSGPITDSDSRMPAYVACMTLLRNAGVRTVAYISTKNTTYSGGVWTQTGFRTSSAVRAYIDTYRASAMGTLLDGFFVDEVSTRWQATSASAWGDHAAYYRALFAEIRGLNPAYTVGMLAHRQTADVRV